ncbi:MAG: hypothetical protein FWD61_05290 [Phycisphaerales bacterium]|nr:hypothetical protein [Phycisphaerales bacterium]
MSTFFYWSASLGNGRKWIGLYQGPGAIVVGGVLVKDPTRHTPSSGLWGYRLPKPKFLPEFWPSKNPENVQYYFGFSVQYIDYGPGRIFVVAIPFWFLVLLSAAGLWLAWRKTQPEFRGFPVEMKSTPPK